MSSPSKEAQRLAALESFRILDTEAEAIYDDVARLAAEICQTAAGLVTFVDESRVWLKAAAGTERGAIPREISFCRHLIEGNDDALVVPDAQRDARFVDSPLVTGEPGVRFYVGVPLLAANEERIGTVCVFDYQPREVAREKIDCLRRLGRQVMSHLERRLIEVELRRQLAVAEQTAGTLRASEEFKSRIIETSRDCIKVLDLQGRLLFMNAGGLAATGICDFSKVARANWIEFWHPDYQAAAAAAVRAAGEGQSSRFIGFFTDAYGIGKWWDCSVVGMRGIDGQIERLLAVSHDVNELRKAADLMRAITEGTAAVTGEEFYRELVRHVAAALNVRHCLVTERMATNELRPLAKWSDGALGATDSYPLAGAPCEEVFTGKSVHYETGLPERFRPWCGRVAPGAVSYLGVPIFSSRQVVVGHLAVMDAKALPPDALAIQVLEIFAHRVGAELERSRTAEQLRQAQKMEAIGRLSAGIAHDFNNLLTVIRGNASLLRLGGMSAAETSAAVADVEHAANHGANLTRQLLTFSRQHPFEPRGLELNEVVRGAVQLLARLIGENIALKLDCAPGNIFVTADPGMVEQVLLNLAINARDAMPTGGRLTLSTATLSVSRPPFLSPQGVEPGDYAVLTVADSGTGIAREHLPQIFEPFFTTKPEGKGTGLGLATVFGIVQQHRGFIDVESEVGRGTIFRVHLPFSLEVAPVLPASADTHSLRRPEREGILVVEDEPAVRNLMGTLLARQGYQVWAAESAAAALAHWQEHRSAIGLLVVDAVIKGSPNGFELSERLSREKPALRVMHCSGYSRELVAKNYALPPTAVFLAKPFDTKEFLEKVRRLLDAPGDAAAARPFQSETAGSVAKEA
jgi:PAS domain S-box-containing protein